MKINSRAFIIKCPGEQLDFLLESPSFISYFCESRTNAEKGAAPGRQFRCAPLPRGEQAVRLSKTI